MVCSFFVVSRASLLKTDPGDSQMILTFWVA